MDGGLQHRTPAFPPGLSLTTGVHCITQTSRVSGLTGSTPPLHLARDGKGPVPGFGVRSLRRRPLRRPSTPGHDDPARSSATRNVCSEAISGSKADTENTQDHYEYFKHGPTIALLVPCSIRQIRTLLTFRGSNTDSI